MSHAGGNLDRPEVPTWALTIGVVVALVFAGLVVQTFTGRPLLGRVVALLPASRSGQLTAGDSPRALYVPASTVQVGQSGLGARGQDRVFQPGDTVLLGATGQLVRIEDDGHLTEIHAAEGATVLVTSLGPWDPARGSVAGLTARYVGGTWALDSPRIEPSGPALRVQAADEEALADGFQIMPPTAGRIRRFESGDGPILRLRPTGRVPALTIEGGDPLPSLDNVAVTVRATVRASEGATVELALHDVIDGAGTVQKTADRRTVAREDEWLTLRAARRVSFGSPSDRFTIGLLDVRSRDWLEIRDLGVYLGLLP